MREPEPRRGRVAGALASDSSELHRGLIARGRNARDLGPKRIEVRSLLDSRLRLSPDRRYALLAAHGRRQISQAERALKRAGSSGESTHHGSQ